MIIIILMTVTMTMTMTTTVCFKGFSIHPNIYTGTKQSKSPQFRNSLLFLEQATADFIGFHSLQF